MEKGKEFKNGVYKKRLIILPEMDEEIKNLI